MRLRQPNGLKISKTIEMSKYLRFLPKSDEGWGSFFEYKLYHKQTAAMTALLGSHANTDMQLRYKRSADCDSAKWRTKKCKIIFGTIICTFLQRKWQTCFAHVFLNFWRFVQRLVDRFQVMFIRLVGLVLL